MNHILIITKTALTDYKPLIEAANLPNASIQYAKSTADGEKLAPNCNIWFGSPSQIAPLLEQGIVPDWVQSTWAGVEPYVQPHMPTHYTLTNMRGIFSDHIGAHIMALVTGFARGLPIYYARQSDRRWQPDVETVFLPEATASCGRSSRTSNIAIAPGCAWPT